MAAMITASRAETGCLGYSYAEDVLDPGLIRVCELWTDLAALYHRWRNTLLTGGQYALAMANSTVSVSAVLATPLGKPAIASMARAP